MKAAKNTLHTYQPGDKVKHRPAFLRSTGWYTDVPRYGIVRAARTWDGMEGKQMLEVEWRESDAPRKILSTNVMPYSVPDYFHDPLPQ